MRKDEVGIWFKGHFCPLYSTVYILASPAFFPGGLRGLSRTLRAGISDVGVVVMYED